MTFRHLFRLILLAMLAACLAAGKGQAQVKVVASIKPVHSLVASVMAGVSSPDLLMRGAGSPHSYSLRPSQAEALQSADVVFWIGHELEAFLEKPITSISKSARASALLDAAGVNRLPLRTAEGFDAHKHEHDDHAHGTDRNHDTSYDAHIWLDPENARQMIEEIARVLSEADPDNSERYKANAAATDQKITELTDEISRITAPLKNEPFIVFHDAYQYFESRFGLAASAAITFNPEARPSARRVKKLKKRIVDSGAMCVFSEPQFDPAIVDIITEGIDAKTLSLDPMGSEVESGPELYFALLRNMAGTFEACLSQE